jgi:hypothetical protein
MKRKNEDQIWQVLGEDRYGIPGLATRIPQSWFESKEEAEKYLAECKSLWKDSNFWIEQGTEYITKKCRHCETVYCETRRDAYGIYTGEYCDDCYKHHYPYKKYRYNYRAYGESLD